MVSDIGDLRAEVDQRPATSTGGGAAVGAIKCQAGVGELLVPRTTRAQMASNDNTNTKINTKSERKSFNKKRTSSSCLQNQKPRERDQERWREVQGSWVTSRPSIVSVNSF